MTSLHPLLHVGPFILSWLVRVPGSICLFQAASVYSRKNETALLVTSVSPNISSHWFRLVPCLSLHPLFFVAKRMECADWLRSEVTCPPLDLEVRSSSS